MKLSILIIIALLLSGSAPGPARPVIRPAIIAAMPVPVPVVVPHRQACDRETAPYQIEAAVLVGDRPIGHATAWSCVSMAAALAELARQEALTRGEACERFGVCR